MWLTIFYPFSYTLYDQEDASAYAHLLLKVLDELIGPRAPPCRRATSLRVAKLPLDSRQSMDDALQHLDCDFAGVATHYVVSRLCDVITALKDAAAAVTETTRKTKATLSTTFFPSGILVDDWRPLLRILLGERSDTFAQRGAAYCLSVILMDGCQLQQKGLLFQDIDPILESFVSWMTSRLQTSSAKSLSIVTPSLVTIIMSEKARDFFDQGGGTGYLARHLRLNDENADTVLVGPSAQQVYELAFALWIMSFDCLDNNNNNAIRRRNFHRNGAVRALVDLVTGKPREKVIRCVLNALVNLATCEEGQQFLVDMVGSGLMTCIDNLKHRQITDPDILQGKKHLPTVLMLFF